MKLLKRFTALFLALSIMVLNIPSAYADASEYYIKVGYQNVNVRKGPGIGYDLIGQVKAGASFTYLGANFDSVEILWYKIQDKNGKIAWISSNYSRRYPVKAIKRPAAAEFISDGTPGADIQETVNRCAKDYNAVGVQVAAIRGSDGRIFDWVYGYSKDAVKPIANGTKIRCASISKVVTAMCAMKMQEEGIVDLNKRIDSYWGKALPKGISLATLLTHTSTVGYLSIQTTREKYLSQLSYLTNYTEAKAGSSKAWSYNNYGYAVAAATLELASGTVLNDYARKNIFDPIGLDVSFFPGDIKKTSALATHYESDGSLELTVTEAKHMLPSGNLVENSGSYVGGLTASARDVAKIFYTLSNDGRYGTEQILKPETVAAMEKRYFTTEENGGSFKQCIALRYKDDLYNTKNLYYHTGNAYGVIALASYDPVNKNAVVVLTTGASHARDDQGVYKICAEITAQVYDKIAKL